MKTLKTIMILTISAFMLSSCAASFAGFMSDSAALSSNNFKYEEQNIQGTSKATYVFGVGGNDKEALVFEAKKNMLKNNPLKDNQAIANLVVDYKYAQFLIVTTVSCTVTADIVEFR